MSVAKADTTMHANGIRNGTNAAVRTIAVEDASQDVKIAVVETRLDGMASDIKELKSLVKKMLVVVLAIAAATGVDVAGILT